MKPWIRRRLGRLCAAAALVLPLTPAAGHPLQIDDLLKQEAFDFAAFDPSGRWLLLEVQRPYETSASFENYYLSRLGRARVLKVDLRRPGPARPAFAQARGGYLLGGFSPSGVRALVFWEKDARREVGVLDLATGQVRWLGLGVEMDHRGATFVWRSDRELLLLALDPRDRPEVYRSQVGAMLELPSLWRRALAGLGSSAVVQGSGRFIDRYPHAPDRRLMSIEVRTGRRRTLASGPFESLSLAPAGDRLAIIQVDGRAPEAKDVLVGPDWPSRRRSLRLLDLASGRLSAPAGDADIAADGLRWSMGGDLLIATGGHVLQPRLYRLKAEAAVAAPVDLASLTLGGLVLGPAGRGVHFDWMGETPIVYAQPTAGGRFDWYRLDASGPINLSQTLPAAPARLSAVGENEALALARSSLWKLTADGTAAEVVKARTLTVVEPRDGNLSTFDPSDRPAARGGAWIVADGALSHVGLEDEPSRPRDAAAAAMLSQILQASRIVAAAPGGSVRVDRDAHGSEQVLLVRPGAPTLSLLSLNRRFAKVDWSAPIALDHPGSTGERFKDWLYLPPGRRPEDHYPLVVMGYPGDGFRAPPHGGRPGADQVDDNPQLLAAAGFAVLVPSLPRTGDDVVDGMTSAVLEAVERAGKLPCVDAGRLGFWGHSAGGLLGYTLATQTDRFKAIVAAAGPSDLISDRGVARPSGLLGPDWDGDIRYQIAWTELGQGGLHATPYTDLAHYLRASPIFAADKITTPMLIVEGDQDPVPFAQGEEMFSALYRDRKDALFLMFFGEAHTISSPANLRLYQATAISFLRRELSAAP